MKMGCRNKKLYQNSYYFSLIPHKMSNIIFFFFQKGINKCDLNDKSKTGNDPNQITKESLDRSQISQASNIAGDIFTKNLNSRDYVAILFHSLKNLRHKMKEIFAFFKKTAASQIKCEKQLPHLTDFVQLI